MGNCCGSQSALDDDDGPTQPRPAVSRPSKPRKPTGPGHTLGGPPVDTSGGVDPRTAAAIAAQVQKSLDMTMNLLCRNGIRRLQGEGSLQVNLLQTRANQDNNILSTLHRRTDKDHRSLCDGINLCIDTTSPWPYHLTFRLILMEGGLGSGNC
jgi:hypothetical protein